MAKSIMFVGTSSNVGKSILCTALCRILTQDGYDVAPFKAQNMSLNSAVTPSGREIGRAQAVQAEACGIAPNEHMNPVLLKPTGAMRSQVVLQGRVHETASARTYFQGHKELLWQAVQESHHFLALRHQVIVMEGAGSPVEMNLKPRDIVNMRAAEMADAAVFLVADIDRGGVFASVVGTMHLLTVAERDRVKGIIINKFRGDKVLFEDGVKLLEEYTGVPVLGVIPFIRDIRIDEEDSVGLASSRYQTTGVQAQTTNKDQIRIAIVQVPHISNFTDFDPLFLEPRVDAFFCQHPKQLDGVHAVVLPGSKNTIHDLEWLKAQGFATALHEVHQRGVPILGICGGYQMLGMRVLDPTHQESDMLECPGLGLLPVETEMMAEKHTIRVEGTLAGPDADVSVRGYEIHMGATKPLSLIQPFARVRGSVEIGGNTDSDVNGDGAAYAEGAISPDGSVMGTYLHGILDNDVFRQRFLNRLCAQQNLSPIAQVVNVDAERDAAYNRLADVVRENLDMQQIYQYVSEHGTGGIKGL